MAPITITITYSVAGFSGSNVAAVVVSVPSGIDWTQHARNIRSSGGFTFVSASGVNTWIPVEQIISITNP
jgi:hypothetical protein